MQTNTSPTVVPTAGIESGDGRLKEVFEMLCRFRIIDCLSPIVQYKVCHCHSILVVFFHLQQRDNSGHHYKRTQER